MLKLVQFNCTNLIKKAQRYSQIFHMARPGIAPATHGIAVKCSTHAS